MKKIPRGLLVYALVMAGVIALVVRFKPDAGDVREHVHRAIADYEDARQGESGAVTVRTGPADVSGLAITQEESRDWVLARSYGATYDGGRFFCFAGAGVTFCSGPDEGEE